MNDAYTIGLTLALEDGVSAGIETIRRELATLDQAIVVSTSNLLQLQDIARAAVSADVVQAGAFAARSRESAAAAARQASVAAAGPQVTESQEEPVAARPAGPGSETRPTSPTARLDQETAPPPDPQLRLPIGASMIPPAAVAERPPQVQRPVDEAAAPTSVIMRASPEEPSKGAGVSPFVSPAATSGEVRPKPVAPTEAPVWSSRAVGVSPSPIMPSEPVATKAASRVPAPPSLPAPPLPPPAVVSVAPAYKASPDRTVEAARSASPVATLEIKPPREVSVSAPREPARTADRAPPSYLPQMAPVRDSPRQPGRGDDRRSSAPRQQDTRDREVSMSGMIVIDGTELGRWIVDYLAHAAGRPPTSGVAFDTRMAPVWAGAPIGA